MDDEERRVEKMKANLEEHEAGSAEEAKKFNPKDLLTKKIYEVIDPELGIVRFGDVTVGESKEISRCKDDQEKAFKVIHLALVKAYPDLKFDEVKKFPLIKGGRLIKIIGEKTGFLEAAKKRPGSKSPLKSKQS